jgi:hypothetical protein
MKGEQTPRVSDMEVVIGDALVMHIPVIYYRDIHNVLALLLNERYQYTMSNDRWEYCSRYSGGSKREGDIEVCKGGTEFVWV